MVISPIPNSPSSAQSLEKSAAYTIKHDHDPCSVVGDSNDENPSLFLSNSISSRNQGSRSDTVTEVFQTRDLEGSLSTLTMSPPPADFASSRRHDTIGDYNSMLQKFSAPSFRLEHQSPNQKQANSMSPQYQRSEKEQEIHKGFVPRFAAAHRYRASQAQYSHFSGRQRALFDFQHTTRIKIFLGYLEDIDTVPEDVRYWHDDTCFIIKDRYPKVSLHN
ncbi:hypothetical protein EC968_000875 [Mortierella alpina]|nr:hypothetical protein EC968_000875 [Mortierella alpina]